MDSSLTRRSPQIEMLDSGLAADDGIHENLQDLRFYNAWFGGTRRLIREVEDMVGREGRERALKILDVGTGSADIPARLAGWGRSRGLAVHTGALDRNPGILGEARRYLEGKGHGGVSLLQGDARRLPVSDGGVDLAVCSNFLHHMDSSAAREVLGEMARVSRIGVVVVDLVRSRAALGLVWLLTRLTSANAVTRCDGTLSVRRAFTPPELQDLAREAGLSGVRVRRVGPVRMVLAHRSGG